MAVFVCKWNDGNFSVVQAKNREEAIANLDEVGYAGSSGKDELFPVSNFMAHFRVTDDLAKVHDVGTPFQVEGFGAEFKIETVWGILPTFYKLWEEVEEPTKEAMTAALKRERGMGILQK